MKPHLHYSKVLHLMVLVLIGLFALTGNTHAQDCNSSFYSMREGASFTLTSYDTKNKPLSKVAHTYSKVTKSGNGLKAQVQQEVFDGKDKSISKGNYEIACQNGVITLNMQDLMGPGMNLQDANIQMEMSGDALELPSDLAVGQKLKDATLHMKGMMGQVKIMDQQMKITDRKVESKETIETPAGKFDSYKVTYLTEMKGMMGKPHTIKSVVWYAKGPGMVKTESYDAKGKLTGYTVLTQYSK